MKKIESFRLKNSGVTKSRLLLSEGKKDRKKVNRRNIAQMKKFIKKSFDVMKKEENGDKTTIGNMK